MSVTGDSENLNVVGFGNGAKSDCASNVVHDQYCVSQFESFEKVAEFIKTYRYAHFYEKKYSDAIILAEEAADFKFIKL